MVRVAHNHDALSPDYALHFATHLSRQALLHLQPARKDIDKSRNLAQTDDFAVGNIAYRNIAEERQDMMLAHRVELDILDHDNLRAFVLEKSLMDNRVDISAIA